LTLKFKILGLITIGLLSSAGYAKKIEPTICFSKSDCNDKYAYGIFGNGTNLCGGKCNGKTLPEMNKAGWKLIQVVGGLQSSFGMIFTKEK